MSTKERFDDYTLTAGELPPDMVVMPVKDAKTILTLERKRLAGVELKLVDVVEFALEGLEVDGGHHKQWYLEQILKCCDQELPEHEEGIAP